MKKILITGISSEIMQKFVPLIDFSQYKVIGITRNPENIKLSNIESINCDVCDIESLCPYFEGCHTVIHAAAVTHSLQDSDYYKVNLEYTKKVVDITIKFKVNNFIFISSNTAGTKSGTYGLSKLLAEQYIKQNLNYWIIFRPSEIYGTRKTEGIEKLIKEVVYKSVVFCPTDVPAKFYPVYIDDVVRIMYDYIFNKKINKKIITINGPQGFSFHEIIELTKTISDSQVKVISINKFVMSILKRAIKIMSIDIGIVPDQIDRLYGTKSHKDLGYDLMNLETYIKQLFDQMNNPHSGI